MKDVTPPGFHDRNLHQGEYDFALLSAGYPALAPFVRPNAYRVASIDFANPQAVKALNAALLKQFYGVAHWDIPPQYLCPPIPSRADYLHHLADLLGLSNGGNIPQGSVIRALDVGVGANCIYPLLGHSAYGWSFVGSDIDAAALAAAQSTLAANAISHHAIELRLQSIPSAMFAGVICADELFDLTLCNPPFHSSMSEAQSGSQRKWKNLGKSSGKSAGKANSKATAKLGPAPLNFGGLSHELWCEGGEEGFISRMIAESLAVRNNCLWFSTLVSKASTLPIVSRALKKVGVAQSRTIQMTHGQKSSRIVVWSFFDARQQQAWRNQQRA